MNIELLNERYHIMKELGRGAQGVTYLAGDIQTENLVAVKELRWDEIEDWKAQELFEREAAVLRRLQHIGIPDFVDAFETDGAFYLVQEFVEGKNLKQLLDDGHVWAETALKRAALDILEVLEYLHGHSPPILHRDIKPSNIILQPGSTHLKHGKHAEENHESRFVLVDFGAVQVTSNMAGRGSTVIGTPGYMSMEQLQGRAVPATDLYGLAATVVHLASGTDPTHLDVSRGKLLFADQVNLSRGFVAALEGCLEPHVEDRLQSVAAMRAAMRGKGRRAEAEDDTYPSLREVLEGKRPIGRSAGAKPELEEPVSVLARMLGAEDDEDESLFQAVSATATRPPDELQPFLQDDGALTTAQSHSRLEQWVEAIGANPDRVSVVGVPSFDDVPAGVASDMQMAGFVPLASLSVDGRRVLFHKFVDLSNTVELTFEGKHYAMLSYLENQTVVGCSNRQGAYKRTEDIELFVAKNSIRLDYRDQLRRIGTSGLLPVRIETKRQSALAHLVRGGALAKRVTKTKMVMVVSLAVFTIIATLWMIVFL